MQPNQGAARGAAKQSGGDASLFVSPGGVPPEAAAAAASADKLASLHVPLLNTGSGDTVGAGQVAAVEAAGPGAGAVRSAVGCMPAGEHRKQSGVPPAVSVGPGSTAAGKPWQQQPPSTVVVSGSHAVVPASSKKRNAPMPASTGMPQQQQQQQVAQDERHAGQQMHKKHRAQASKPAAPAAAPPEAAAGLTAAQGIVAPAAAAVPAGDAQWPCQPTEADVTAASEAAANCNRMMAHASSTLKAVGIQRGKVTAGNILESGMLPPGTQLDSVSAKIYCAAADQRSNVVGARFLVHEAAASSGCASAGPPRHELHCVACGAQCTTLKAACQHAARKSGHATKQAVEKLLLVGTGGVSLKQFLGMLADHGSQHSPAPTPAAAAAGAGQCSSQPKQWQQQQQQAHKQQQESGASPAAAARAKWRNLQQQQLGTARDGSANTAVTREAVNHEPSDRDRTASYRQQPMQSPAPQHPTGSSSRRSAHKQQQAMRTKCQALQSLESGFGSSAALTPVAAAGGAAGVPEAAAVGAADVPEAAGRYVADGVPDGREGQQIVTASGSQLEQQCLQQCQWPEQQGNQAPQDPWLWVQGVLDETHQQQLFNLLESSTPAAGHVAHLLGCLWCLPRSSDVGAGAVLQCERIGSTAAASSVACYWDWDQVLEMGLAAAMLQLQQSAMSPSSCVDKGLLAMCLGAAQQAFGRDAAQAVSAAAAAAAVEASLVESASVVPRLRHLVVELVRLAEQHFTSCRALECFASIASSVITIGCWTINVLAVLHGSLFGGSSSGDTVVYKDALQHLGVVVLACELLNQLSAEVEVALWNRAWDNIRKDADRWTKRYEYQQLQVEPYKQLPYAWVHLLCNQLVNYKALRQRADWAC